jgi:hypothetical protein
VILREVELFSGTPKETAMLPQPPMSGEPSWQQLIELETRKEAIERWLSSMTLPSQLVETLQEMLAQTELQLKAARSQGLDNTSSSPSRAVG